MDTALIEKYISNPDRYCNTPDEISFCGEVFDFVDKNAYPFSYVQMPGTNQYQLLFGEPGTSHDKIRDKIVNEYRKRYFNNFTALDKLFGGYMRKEYVGQMARAKASPEECIERAIKFGGRQYLEQHEQNGRYFLISQDDIEVCVFAFWNVYKLGDDDEDYLGPNSPDITKLVKMIMELDQRIEQCDLILIANNEEPYYVYKEDTHDDFFKIGDNSAQRAIHLANQQQKRDFFADFRKNRDQRIGQKLTMDNGKEMPLAQYNALRYVDESKKEPKRVFITEAQLNEYLDERKKKLYSWHDKLELVKDKNIVDGGNFPIKRNGKEYWISRSTTVGVYVFCLDQTGVIYTLASKRGPHVHTQQNLWNAPCGYLEYGDSIKETAVKECWEETGVKIPMEKLVYLGENSEFSRNSDVKHTFYCVLDGLITDYPPSMANCEPGEVTDVRWIPLDELDKYQFVGQQAKKLYNIGFKLFKRVGIYKTNKDYATIIQSLQNMLSSGIIDNEQIARIKDVLNI